MNMIHDDKILFENIQRIIGIYLTPIVCLFGLIGNILCIIGFITNTLQRYLTTQFLLYLAIADTIKLSNDLLYSFVVIIQLFKQEFGNKLFLRLYSYCHYINFVSALCTAWLTLVVAIERCILCSTNNQTRLQIHNYSRMICNGIIFFAFILAIPVSYRYEKILLLNETLNDSNLLSIRLSKFGSSLFFRAYTIIFDVLRALLPSLLLLYLNTRIIYLLSQKKSTLGIIFCRLTISLIIIIACFICCYFPDALLSLILNMGYVEETYYNRAIREITDFFLTVNSATNFPIFFSISYTFRRATLRLCHRQKRLRRSRGKQKTLTLQKTAGNSQGLDDLPEEIM